MASTIPASDGGPSKEEGLSSVVFSGGSREERFLLRDAVAELKGRLIGEELWARHGGWPMFAKFFDNSGAIAFHIHHREECARMIGARGKSEAYFYPAQMNSHRGSFPYTFFGLTPGTTRDDVRGRLELFEKGDNNITELSCAYRLIPGTGWDVPAGLLHAPGSLCTYEPQIASDAFSMFQSVAANVPISGDLLWRGCPVSRRGDYDFLLDLVDWEGNLDDRYAEHHFMNNVPAIPAESALELGYTENWICWRSTAFSAKELTVLPGRSVHVREEAAYGLIVVQGHGKFGAWNVASPSSIRFGQLTEDELFVSAEAAKAGVAISNASDCEPLVILKHFGQGSPLAGAQ
jgi:hypothetical protein